MNLDKLKALVRRIAVDSGVTVQEVYDNYFFECFLYRLSISKYAESYILKGGFLLESVLGISNRTTLDIDFLYTPKKISKNNLKKHFQDIFSASVDDDVVFTLLNIETIRKHQKYDGLRVIIKASLKNITRIFNVDIATNDVITPGPVNYDYKSVFDLQTYTLKTYSSESIVSEKFESIINLGTNNSRMKDLYDIHLLLSNGNLNRLVLHDALINTFNNRNTNISRHFIEQQITEIKQSRLLKQRFLQFKGKAKYSVDATYEEVVESLVKVKEEIFYIEPLKLNVEEIIFIRHGEDDQTKVGGWSDNKLTAKGVLQVEKLKPIVNIIMVRKKPVILSSDLVRTQETVKILFDSETVIYEPAFRECNNGLLKNMNIENFLNLKPTPFFSFLQYNERYPGGESPQDLYIRVEEAIKKLNNQYKEKSVILVAHTGVYGILYSLLKGYRWSNKQHYRLNYAELTILKDDTYSE